MNISLKGLAILSCMIFSLKAAAQDSISYLPQIHGTIRSKYEYQPQIEKGRFEVRTARVSFEGNIIPIISYKAEIDFCDEGVIKMLDAYVRANLAKPLNITAGQMRVPFTIDAHRSPHLQYFVNRSFIAKQVANVRDVGASLRWTPDTSLPIILEGGVFNGSGLTNQKNYWTSSYNYSFKAQTMIAKKFNITLSLQQTTTNDVRVQMYDAGAYYQDNRWHIEGEYLRKYYKHDRFETVNAVDFFTSYRMPLNGKLKAISFLGRYDYMSDHSNGKLNSDGELTITDPERHRVTGGVTLSFGTKKLQTDLRLNYEQYFYEEGVTPAISEQNKLAVEFVCHF
jgi:phosphate-selective porin